jgi:hypothetical protein
VLGVSPQPGRGFSQGEDSPGAGPVVVIGEGLWKRRFGASPTLLGQSVTLDGQPYTVIGVLPASVQFPAGTQMDLFVPLSVTGPHAETRGSRFLSVIGRLKSGVSVEAANTELRELVTRLREAYPNDLAGRGAAAEPLTETVMGKVRPVLLILQCTVVLVLLIACANVANLLLAQGATRRPRISPAPPRRAHPPSSATSPPSRRQSTPAKRRRCAGRCSTRTRSRSSPASARSQPVAHNASPRRRRRPIS